MQQYSLVVLGGTFDHFHKGHTDFLDHAFSISEKVLIGLTSDSYTQKKENTIFESYAIRVNALRTFLKERNFTARAEILPIDANYIPKGWEDRSLNAIVVTNDSVTGAESINKKRVSEHKHALPVVVVNLTPAEDAHPITSTRIRNGTISRNGRRYINDSLFEKKLYLPPSLRGKLHEPFGPVSEFRKSMIENIAMDRVITVGDVTTHIFLKNSFYPKIAVIDFIVERERKYSSFTQLGFTGNEKIYYADNPPGQLTPSLFQSLQAIFSEHENNSILHIEGEEDLTVLPLLLFSPLHYHVFYGQPSEGLVHVEVTEEKKEKAYDLLSQFTSSD